MWSRRLPLMYPMLSDASAEGGIGSACGPGADDGRPDEIADNRVLAEARRLGLNDNATVAAALWR